MSDLREKVIKLAHAKPELRQHLLPILKTSALMSYRAETLLYDAQTKDMSQRWKRTVNAFKKGNIDYQKFLRTAANILRIQAGGNRAYPGAEQDISQISTFLKDAVARQDWTVLYDVSFK